MLVANNKINQNNSMKKLQFLIVFTSLFLIIASTMVSCGKKCKNQNPQIKLINSSNQNVDVTFVDATGAKVTINNLAIANATNYYTLAQGDITCTVTANGSTFFKTVSSALSCFNYDLNLEFNNYLTINAVDRNQ